MRALTTVTPDHLTMAVAFNRLFDDLSDGCRCTRFWTEILGPGQILLAPEFFGEYQITCQWLKDVLPRADCLRTADV